MKISEMIQDIVDMATEKFGNTTHNNDLITVYISSPPEYGATWEVGLERPTQNQLDHGEIMDVNTVKVWEIRTAFDTEGDSLPEALQSLRDKVEEADEFDFQALV